MIVLDTNVLSEAMKPEPNDAVVRWIDAYEYAPIVTCAPVSAEIRYGVAIMPPSKRRQQLLLRVDELLEQRLRGKVLPFDEPASVIYANILARRRSVGEPMTMVDAMIAAIALRNLAILATRNMRHFAGIGLELVNPFDLA